MLAAGVEAAADLDLQVLHRRIKLAVAGRNPLAQFRGQAAGRRNAELAGVRSRTGGDVAQGGGAGLRQADRRQVGVEAGQIGLADPAQHDVLFNRGARQTAVVAPGDVGQRSHLLGRDVAQRQAHGRHCVARLALRHDVARHPVGKPFGLRLFRQGAGRPRGDLVRHTEVVQVERPATVLRQDRAFFQHQSPKFLDAQLGHQEFQARPRPVLLFTQPREDPADRLRQGQDFFLRHKFVQQLRLVRNSTQSAADVEGETAPQLAVFDPCLGDEADVVHVGQTASVIGAARKGDLELAAKILGVLVIQQEIRQRRGRRASRRSSRRCKRQTAGRPSRCAPRCRMPLAW